MAVQTTRLDGNNIGFFLDGVASADVLTLNLATGAVSSAFLSPADLAVLSVGVAEIFKFVPLAVRTPAAGTILQRLVGLSAADAGAYAPSAVVVASDATLRVTGTVGGRFIVHVPHSIEGYVAWATGLAGGGGGGLYLKDVSVEASTLAGFAGLDYDIPVALDPKAIIFGAKGTISQNSFSCTPPAFLSYFNCLLWDPPDNPPTNPMAYIASVFISANMGTIANGKVVTGYLGSSSARQNWTAPFWRLGLYDPMVQQSWNTLASNNAKLTLSLLCADV